MFIPRLYYPYLLECGLKIAFDKEKSHYLSTVLRLEQNSPIILFNGQGGEYSANIDINRKQLLANVASFNPINRETSLPIHLGQGLARGDRMDIVVQKATELGVMSITPLFTKQSTVKLDVERANKRVAHWQNIAISAAEQCGRTQLPTIFCPMALRDWVAQPFAGHSIMFAPTAPHTLKTLPSPKAVRLAIGPESGWEKQETALMTQHEFMAATLGPRILRTETASIVAISLIQGLFGDL